MIEFLKTIVEMFTSAFHFLSSFVSSTFNLISKIPVFSNFLITAMDFMPPFLIPFLVAAISMYVILFILGRN